MVKKIRIRLWMILLAGVVCLYLPGLLELQELRSRRDELRTEIRKLKTENLSLLRERELLKQDIGYIERVARKKMGVVRKGEIPYKVVVEEAPPE